MKRYTWEQGDQALRWAWEVLTILIALAVLIAARLDFLMEHKDVALWAAGFMGVTGGVILLSKGKKGMKKKKGGMS